MGEKDVDEKEVERKIVKWNDIFEELALDAKALIKDLSEGINYIAFSALIVMLMGGAALVIGLDRGETKYIAAGFIIFCILSFNGAVTLRKWYTLRKRYSRLQSLQKELESN